MTSQSQELKGYPIPNVINPTSTRCIVFTIPDDDDYHRACIAQITLLTKWWQWKRTNPQDAHAKQSAEAFASVLAYSPLDNPLDCALVDGELEMFNCGDVEDCLEASTIVNNIETNITNVSNTVNNHTTEITNLTENVNEITENSIYNEYPPEPVPILPNDGYCGASHALANYLNDFIQDVITDAGTITFQEFVTAILGLGGFKAGIVKTLWDYIVASINPTLSTEVSDAIPYVAEAFYCNNLIVSSARQAIIDDPNISSDAEATYVSAIDSLTTAKYSELIYLGSLDESQDCNGFMCECASYDWTLDLHGFVVETDIWVEGQGLRGRKLAAGRFNFFAMSHYFNISRVEFDYYMDGSLGNQRNIIMTTYRDGVYVNELNTGHNVAYQEATATVEYGASNVNGLRMFVSNTGTGASGVLYVRRARIYGSKVTGAPQNSVPAC